LSANYFSDVHLLKHKLFYMPDIFCILNKFYQKVIIIQYHKPISILADESGEKYYSQVVTPIISEGDPIGAVIFLSTDPDVRMGEVEAKLAQSAAGFLGKQMEQ